MHPSIETMFPVDCLARTWCFVRYEERSAPCRPPPRASGVVASAAATSAPTPIPAQPASRCAVGPRAAGRPRSGSRHQFGRSHASLASALQLPSSADKTPHERGLTASEAAFVAVEESAPCRCISSRSPIRDGPRCSPGPSTGFSTDSRSVDTRRYGAAILGPSAAAICSPCPAATHLGGHQCRLSQERQRCSWRRDRCQPELRMVCMPKNIRRPISPHPPSLWV